MEHMHDEASATVLRLADMQPGQRAIITGYETVASAYRSKLLAMGLTRGTELTLCRIAPLGDPVEIEVRGFRLTLRTDEAAILHLASVDG